MASMRIASLNLNKRLGNASARLRALEWLRTNEISLVLTQEPYRNCDKPPSLDGFRPLVGNHQVFAWIAESLEPPPSVSVRAWWQRLELGYLVVHNVYLDPYSRRSRGDQLEELHDHVRAEPGQPMLIVGDFNLAPRPEDGCFDGKASRFNSDVDRGPFRRLLVDVRLQDLTSAASGVQYSIVRERRGKRIEFRCDLALASDYIAPTITANYHHDTRAGALPFTDHSALVLNLPVTPPSLDEHWLWPTAQSTDAAPGSLYQPHKTAMARSRPSPFARSIEQSYRRNGVRSVLDYGCGRGADVEFYRRIGLVADGYDPHPSFGWHAQPRGTYDLITVIFVLNVLPDPWQRFKVLRNASGHLADDGSMLVVCRSPSSIERIARSRRWPRHNDGYWSSERKGTFQRGISSQELLLMAGRIGLVPRREGGERRDTTQLLFTRAIGDSSTGTASAATRRGLPEPVGAASRRC
jgi:hypothetical protein